MEAQSLLVLDLEKCTRCDECTKACSDSHSGVTRLIREGLRFDQMAGGQLVPIVSRSLLPGGLPRGRHSPPRLARDPHRELVHRLRQLLHQLSLRHINMHPVLEERAIRQTPASGWWPR